MCVRFVSLMDIHRKMWDNFWLQKKKFRKYFLFYTPQLEYQLAHSRPVLVPWGFDKLMSFLITTTTSRGLYSSNTFRLITLSPSHLWSTSVYRGLFYIGDLSYWEIIFFFKTQRRELAVICFKRGSSLDIALPQTPRRHQNTQGRLIQWYKRDSLVISATAQGSHSSSVDFREPGWGALLGLCS